MEQLHDLAFIPHLSWGELQRACQQKRHPWRTPILANAGGSVPRQRTVVLRKSDTARRALRFYTDRRSAKWPAVLSGDTFTALFYDPKRKWQLLAIGASAALSIEEEAKIWQQLPVPARAAYASRSAPGSLTPVGQDGLPDGFFEFELSDTEYARSNFAAFELQITTFEVLQLHRSGHRRARFQWDSLTDAWQGQWLIP